MRHQGDTTQSNKCKCAVIVRDFTYAVQVPNIPDSDNVLMYRLQTLFQADIEKMSWHSYCFPILCEVQ